MREKSGIENISLNYFITNMKTRKTITITAVILAIFALTIFVYKYTIWGDVPMFIYRFTKPNFVEDFTLVAKEKKLPKHARKVRDEIVKVKYLVEMFCEDGDSREECLTGEIEVHSMKYVGGEYEIVIFAPIDGDKIILPKIHTDESGSQTGEFMYHIDVILKDNRPVHWESSV